MPAGRRWGYESRFETFSLPRPAKIYRSGYPSASILVGNMSNAPSTRLPVGNKDFTNATVVIIGAGISGRYMENDQARSYS